MYTTRCKGLTLIENLVVIAIIAILAATLFPVFAQARETARQTASINNLKLIDSATPEHKQDYDDSSYGHRDNLPASVSNALKQTSGGPVPNRTDNARGEQDSTQMSVSMSSRSRAATSPTNDVPVILILAAAFVVAAPIVVAVTVPFLRNRSVDVKVHLKID
ncbi:MAG: prepilin-type N-terminal cleavage/methylation domain-containing protein [Capsulimonadaceae bacterium]